MHVRDVMVTPVLTVTATTPLREVAELIAEHESKAVVVVDASGRPTGIVSEPVLARALDEMTEGGGLLRRLTPARRSLARADRAFLERHRVARSAPGRGLPVGTAASPVGRDRPRTLGRVGTSASRAPHGRSSPAIADRHEAPLDRLGDPASPVSIEDPDRATSDAWGDPTVRWSDDDPLGPLEETVGPLHPLERICSRCHLAKHRSQFPDASRSVCGECLSDGVDGS